MSVLVAVNTGLVLFTVGIGWQVSTAGTTPVDVRSQGPVNDTATDMRRHTFRILGGNLQVVTSLLGGAATLGLFTLIELLWNAFGLGFGLSTLARGTPAALPLVIRYVPLEFSAFVLAASAADHLSFMVLRCLATGETPRFTSATLTLAMALGMLVAAAIIEATVVQLVAGLTA